MTDAPPAPAHPSGRALAGLLAACCLAGSSGEELVPGVPRALRLGAGEARVELVHRAGTAAHLHVAAWSAGRDPALAVTLDGHLHEDDDAGGGTTAYLELDVEAGDELELAVLTGAAEAPATVTVVLHELPAPSAADRQALADARAALDAARDAGAPDGRRRGLLAVVRALQDLPDATRHEGPAALCWDAGVLALELGEDEIASSLFGATLAFRQRHLPPDHGDLQEARLNLAHVLGRRGDGESAVTLLRAALAVRERTLPPDHPHLRMTRHNLGSTLLSLGRIEEAARHAEAVWELDRRTLPGDAPDRQRTRRLLASVRAAQGRHAEAAALRRAALGHLRDALAPGDRDLLALQNRLAISLRQAGDLAGSRDVLVEMHAAMAATRPEADEDLLVVRANLAVVERLLGRPEVSLALEERLLAVAREHFAEDHRRVVTARRNVAQSLYDLGRLGEALEHQQAVVDVLRRQLGERHPDVLAARVNASITLQNLGRLAEALDEQEAVLALQLETLPERHPEVVTTRINLAQTRRDLGDLTGALAIERAVLAQRELLSDETLRMLLGNVSLNLSNLGRHDEALELQREALVLAEEALGAEHPDTLLARANLGASLLEAGRVAEAGALLDATLPVAERVLPAGHRHLQAYRTSLANARAARGDAAGALALQEASLRALEARLPADHPQLLATRFNLAGLQARQGEVGAARELLHGALGELTARLALGAVLSERAQREMVARAIRFADLLLSCPAPDGGEAGRDLAAVLAFGGQADRRARLVARFREAAARDPALATRAEAARTARHRFRRAWEQGRADALDDLRAAVEREEESLRRDVARLAGGLDAGPVDLAALAARLGEDEVAVTTIGYHRLAPAAAADDAGEPRVAAFVVAPDAAVERVELGPAGAIHELCGAFRDHLSARIDRTRAPFDVRLPPSAREDGGELADLLAPLLDAVPPGTAALRIAPDAALAAIPWEALPRGAGRLGDALRVSYLESLSALAPRPPLEDAPSLLVLGGIDYDAGLDDDEPEGGHHGTDGAGRQAGGPAGALVDGPQGGGRGPTFRPLPATRGEAETAAALFRARHAEARVTLLGGREATPEAFAREACRARLLHVATHGFAFAGAASAGGERAPADGPSRAAVPWPSLVAGIALAGANGEAGRLTAFELAGLDLSGCELAVLSACDTNVGPRAAGEALAGLNRALQLAGARNTITSLWKVSDEGAARFFELFYGHLWRDGLPLEEAFAATRRALREEGHGPGVWAGFVLYTTGT